MKKVHLGRPTGARQEQGGKVKRRGGLRVGKTAIGFLALFVVAGAHNANAVSSYAVQTAQSCSACHVGGFGPQLTPLGRQFKLEGYTSRATQDFVLPLSAMAVASYLHTSADQPAPPAPHYGTNDNVALDQANLFVAGG